LLAALARAGGDVIGLDWRLPLDSGWSVVGTSEASRATSIPPCCSAPGRASRTPRSTCLAQAAVPATSSTSGGGCPDRSERADPLTALVQERTVEARV
jgi:hypothetical protein